MLLATTCKISGKKVIKTLGLVEGSSIHAKHICKDLSAGSSGIVGDELDDYTEMLETARKHATDRMIENADFLGTDAIIGIRFEISNVAPGASEVLIYGTAVLLEDED